MSHLCERAVDLSADLNSYLKERGVENFLGPSLNLPSHALFEPPCSIKWMQIEHSIEMGAFSYAVSGYFFAARIGRYVSMGENIQLGRHNHPSDWISTSPMFYLNSKMFDVGDTFSNAVDYHNYKTRADLPYNVPVLPTEIGHDVWVGHGAYIRPGVKIGVGAIVAAHAVVVKDVPPFAVVAGNPAVVKKFRIPEKNIEPLLETKWWEYAPWTLRELKIEHPEHFIDQVNQNKDTWVKYEPEWINPSKFNPNIDL